jgi:hypothetical protein
VLQKAGSYTVSGSIHYVLELSWNPVRSPQDLLEEEQRDGVCENLFKFNQNL